jgi:chromosome segregation ATPase
MKGWGAFTGMPAHRHAPEQEEGSELAKWSQTAIPQQRLELLSQQKELSQFVRERRQYETLPDAAWSLVGEMNRQLQELRQQVQAQQKEIDALKRSLAQLPARLPPARETDLQRWKATHRQELARYRGRHVAINPEKGVLADAEDYAHLVEKLELLGVTDKQAAIEFIPLYFASQ